MLRLCTRLWWCNEICVWVTDGMILTGRQGTCGLKYPSHNFITNLIMGWSGIERSPSRRKDAFNRPRHGTAPDSEIFFQFSQYYLCRQEMYS